MQNYLAAIKIKFCKPCKTWYRESDDHFLSESHLINTLGYIPIVETQSAAKCRLKTYWLQNGEGFLDIGYFLNHVKPLVTSKIQQHLLETNSIKCNVLLKCQYEKPESDDFKEICFKTTNEPIFTGTEPIAFTLIWSY